MNLRQLEIFSTVIHEGSFTQAARKLNMAQPAVSIAVRKLEERLELKLIHRADDITPTAEGYILLEHAHQLLNDMRLTQQAMSDLHELKAGQVRLSTSPILGNYFFPEKIQAFRKHYPNIEFQIHYQKTISERHLLDLQQCDLCVVNMQEIPKDFDAVFISQQEVVACVAPTNPLAKKKNLAIAEAIKHPTALYCEGHTLRNIMDREYKKRQITPNIIMESDLTGMILQTVANTQSIGLCLRTISQHEPAINVIPFKKPLYLNVGIGWKNNTYLSAANRAFVDFMETSSNKSE